MADPAFWNDQEAARGVVQRVKGLKVWVEPFQSLTARVTSALELAEMLEAEPDAEMERDLDRDIGRVSDELEAFRLRSMLSGPDDFRDAQVEISAGAGGTEAQDWAQMLMRMYTRWAERRGYTIEILDLSDGEEAGIKGAVLEIKGAVRLRIPEGRDGRAPAGAHLAVRRAGPAAHELRVGIRVPGGGRYDQHRHSRRGPQDGRLPRVGRGRPACRTRRVRRCG